MKSKILTICALALCLSFSAAALADVEEGTFNLSIMGGMLFPNSDMDMDNAAVFGAGLGYNFTKNWGLEGFLHYAPKVGSNEELEPGEAERDDSSIFLGRLNALYHFDTGSAFTPYLTFGIGGMKIDVGSSPTDNEDNDYNSFAANGGLGFKYFFNDVVGIRAEGTYVYGFRKSDDRRASFPLVTAGLVFQFGGGAKEAPCIDADNDAVCDNLDQCPGTPAGYRVDAVGCPITVSIQLDVKFDFDKSVVKHEYRSEVEKAAVFLNNHPGSTAVVKGYTDSKGSDEYNLKLSDRRANAVRDYLVKEFNVAPTRVTAEGHGEADPIATNDTEAGRALNRRVVGVFSGTDVDQ
jgi:OOP family OmpA-OmpF porin